jgi:hypothetical protein
VIDTGKWLPGRKVLIVPAAISQPWHGEKTLAVNLTKEQIRSSPDIDTAEPISRKAEQLLYSHYDWVPYWIAPEMTPSPPTIASSVEERREAIKEAESAGEPNLRSIGEVLGYDLQAKDGKVGHIEDFLLDDKASNILYLVVNLEKWLPRKKVLIPPLTISELDWAESRAVVDMSRRAVESSSEYTPAA